MRRIDRARFPVLLVLTLTLTLLCTAEPSRAEGPDDARPSDTRTRATARGEVVDGMVLVKLRAGASKTSRLDALLAAHGGTAMQKLFPSLDARPRKLSAALQRMYAVTYTSGENPWAVAASLEADPSVEYAEPFPVFRTTGADFHAEPAAPIAAAAPRARPNDPQTATVNYLDQVSAFEAWDVVTGEQGDVVVAVVDGGTDWRHPDLSANIWTNEEEIPDNGRDDDDNGFIDDIHGWNFPENEGDPTGMEDTPLNAQHGTAVAGVLAAVTDNNEGIPSISWNVRFMAINAGGSEDNTIPGNFGYGGIVYAAENGADVINASWGGTGPPIEAFQEIVNFAAAQGALVVSSAGNGGPDSRGDNNDEIPNFPPSYDNVLAVGATFETDDRKTGFSNFGITVDVFAPGNRIYTTFPDGQYGFIGGTSFSSPIVAAVAALVKTQFPDLTPRQLGEQIRATADPIDAPNPNFVGLLGRGRVNTLRAVTETDHHGIRLSRFEFTDSDDDGFAESGETITIAARFTNLLNDATDITLSLVAGSEFVTPVDVLERVPVLQQGDSVDVEFTVRIASDAPNQLDLILVSEALADGEANRDILRLTLNPPTFLTHEANRVTASITDEGNIGWIESQSPSDGAAVGGGFAFDGRSLLFEGGLVVATSPSRVSDTVRGDGPDQEDDFEPSGEVALQINTPGELAFEEGRVTLTDTRAPNPINVRVLQETFADTSNALDQTVFQVLVRHDGSLTVDEVADAVDRERSTAYRSIQRLCDAGFVDKRQVTYENGGDYHVFEPVEADVVADRLQRMLNDWYRKMGGLIGEYRERYGEPPAAPRL